MEVSGQPHAPTSLLPGKERRYPLNRWMDGWMDGLQNQSGNFDGQKNPLPQPGYDPAVIHQEGWSLRYAGSPFT